MLSNTNNATEPDKRPVLAQAPCSAIEAERYIVGMVQRWFASGGVMTFPDGATIRAMDTRNTVLVAKDDGSVVGNLTLEAMSSPEVTEYDLDAATVWLCNRPHNVSRQVESLALAFAKHRTTHAESSSHEGTHG